MVHRRQNQRIRFACGVLNLSELYNRTNFLGLTANISMSKLSWPR